MGEVHSNLCTLTTVCNNAYTCIPDVRGFLDELRTSIVSTCRLAWERNSVLSQHNALDPSQDGHKQSEFRCEPLEMHEEGLSQVLVVRLNECNGVGM